MSKNVTMCFHNACSLRQTCVRTPESGTKAWKYAAWVNFSPDKDGKCDMFLTRAQLRKIKSGGPI